MNGKVQIVHSQSEQEYQKWLRTFYRGNLFVRGWDSIKRDIHASLGHKQDETLQLVDELGDLIGREWAKDNRIRRIDNDDLKRWGQRLERLSRKSRHEIDTVIQSIREEAQERLRG